MNKKKLEYDIVMAHTMNEREKIKSIYMSLVNERSRLDRWFNKYLDMFDTKMNSSFRSDPVWKLYHAKSNEYSDLNSLITTAQYYMQKP